MKEFSQLPREQQPIVEAEKKPLFVVDHVSYTYPYTEHASIQDVSFSLNPGETIGITGDSGSGKSTLLHVLSGVIPHFYKGGQLEGNISFEGRATKDTPLYELTPKIAVVYQDPSTQSFGMTVRDALVFGMENLHVTRDEMSKRIAEISSGMHIDHILDKNTMEISGGESQATVIASMLAMNPDVILFDEVISALDVGGQQRIRQTLEQLKNLGRSMVVVDSDVEWLAQTVDRLLIMKNGELIYNGAPTAVFENDYLAVAAGRVTKDYVDFREPNTESAIIQVNNISFSYGEEKKALQDITLEIPQGSCTAIIGHNGSGKTTLAKIMAGLIKPSDGIVTVNDQAIHSLPAHEAVKYVGYVYQNPSHTFSSQRVIDEFISIARTSHSEAEGTLAEFGLDSYKDVAPWDLSAGQQQRLAIASTLAANPRVIILDEPTLGQTRKDRENLIQLIKDKQQSGSTFVLISHDLQFVAEAATNAHILHSGLLIRSDAACEVLNDKQFFDTLGLPLPW